MGKGILAFLGYQTGDAFVLGRAFVDVVNQVGQLLCADQMGRLGRQFRPGFADVPLKADR